MFADMFLIIIIIKMVLTMLSICNSWFTGIIVAHIDKAWGAKKHPNTFQEWQLTVLL